MARPAPPASIRSRLADTPRHYKALGYALSTFSDAAAYIVAASSSDPVELSCAYAVERPFELLENYLIELGRAGLEAARVVDDAEGMSGRQVLSVLSDEGVISQSLRRRLIEVHDLRNQLAHEYPDVRARSLYDAAAAFQPLVQQFIRAYLQWLDRLGFAVPTPS